MLFNCFVEAVNMGVDGDGDWDGLGGGLTDQSAVHLGVVIPSFSFKVLASNQQKPSSGRHLCQSGQSLCQW